MKLFWEAFKAKFPPNRAAAAIMVTVTPILAIAAGDLATWSTRHVAGLHLTQGKIFGVFLAGAGAVVLPAVTAGYKWFSGWIQHEGAKQRKEVALIEAGHQTTVHNLEGS
jgi:hypothetical protein